jgi:hypothetical protein
MRRSALSALLWLGCLHGAHAQEAPFGLSWGPVDTVPKPSMVDREANITALTYFHDRPLAAGIDTDEVILEVCRDEGLQQVIWLSRALRGHLPGGRAAVWSAANHAGCRDCVVAVRTRAPGRQEGRSRRAALDHAGQGRPLRVVLGRPPGGHRPPGLPARVGPDPRADPVKQVAIICTGPTRVVDPQTAEMIGLGATPYAALIGQSLPRRPGMPMRREPGA